MPRYVNQQWDTRRRTIEPSASVNSNLRVGSNPRRRQTRHGRTEYTAPLVDEEADRLGRPAPLPHIQLGMDQAHRSVTRLAY
jgi:hypothetical protein